MLLAILNMPLSENISNNFVMLLLGATGMKGLNVVKQTKRNEKILNLHAFIVF